jgi:hypothetical protein
MNTKNGSSSSRAWPLFAWGLAAAAAFIGATLFVVKTRPDAGVRVAVLLAPLVPLAGLASSIARAIRRMDEMQLRVHLDALTGAFVATAFAAIVIGQLQYADVGVPEINWAFMWPVQVVLWTVAYVVASKRYS